MLIVECPSCTAQFRVPAHVVPQGGRDLRCSSCGHVWHYVDPLVQSLMPSAAAGANPSEIVQAADVPEPEDLPASFTEAMQNVAAEEPVPDLPVTPLGGSVAPVSGQGTALSGRIVRAAGYATACLIAVVVLWVAMAGQSAVTMIVPRLAVVYQLLGVYTPPAHPLVFDAVKLERDGDKITIKGVINNQTGSQRNIPSIRAVLLGADGRIPLAVWVFRAEKTFADTKGKGEPATFSLTRASDQAAKVKSIRLEFAEGEQKE